MKTVIKENKVAFITGASFAVIHVLFLVRMLSQSAEAREQLGFILMFIDFPVMCVFELGRSIFGLQPSQEAFLIFIGIFGTIFYFCAGCALGLFWQWFLTHKNTELDVKDS